MRKPHSRKRGITRRTIGDYLRTRQDVKVEHAIHQHLVRLETLDKQNREFWRDYQFFLAMEREKLLGKITESLWAVRSQSFDFVGGRIVGSEYSKSPLCSVGSYHYPGRFNFAQIASYLPDFKALYLASDYETAFCEKFYRRQDDVLEGLTATELSLTPTGSFSYYRVRAKLDSVLDVRNDEALAGFCEIIATVDPSFEILMAAKRIRSAPPQTIKSVQQLRAALLEENFQQWATWVDQPSPSQWFGHYVRLAGIQGIVYPSVRNTSGYNLSVFPDNLCDSEAEIALIDPSDSVPESDRTLNKTNHLILQNAPTSIIVSH